MTTHNSYLLKNNRYITTQCHAYDKFLIMIIAHVQSFHNSDWPLLNYQFRNFTASWTQSKSGGSTIEVSIYLILTCESLNVLPIQRYLRLFLN